MNLEKKRQRIEDRFKRLGEEIYEYRIEELRELFIIEILDTDPSEKDITIRVTSAIYKNKGGNPEVFHLPISEISSEFDLKNVLVSQLFDTLRKFRENLVEAPVDNPGIQNYLMLKLVFLLNIPYMCDLFLSEYYTLAKNDKRNAILVNIFSHNVGGFLRDEKVRSFFKEVGREDELNDLYDRLAVKKLGFIVKQKNLPYEKRREDILLLKKWFAQRYNISRDWQCLELSKSERAFLLGIATFVSILFFVIGLCYPQYLTLLFSTGIFDLPPFLWVIIAIVLYFSFRSSLSSFWCERHNSERGMPSCLIDLALKTLLINPLEILIPRLFLGVLLGSVLLFGFEGSLWKAVLEDNVHLRAITTAVFMLILIYFSIRFRNEKISSPSLWSIPSRVLVIVIWVTFLSILSVILITISIGKGFICKLDPGSYTVCSQVLVFWVVFSMFAGLFMQLFWQPEKIIEPI